MPTPQSDESLVDEIAATIRARIMSGEFAIGAPLRQAALAAEFGVSRTPIREALRQLQNGGLIEVLPNRGAVIRVPTPWEVREAYEVRAELEGMAARRAADRITRTQLKNLADDNDVLRRALEGTDDSSLETRAANDSFHTVICAAAGNEWLTAMVARINESFPRNVSSLALAGSERHRQENVSQHDAIIEALRAGDADAAREAMHAHIISSGEHLAAWYERRSRTVFHP
ncbi:GntR family transcriptional regulator [Amycolatopsis thermoflava]|uniref:DNA-binding GntR family transcriptional regulator n=1 Tax=Amycolatopsis thermoflava TaxID=84480 RepID=A0A3N2GQJ7_9PSEU|nr:GntR family transcriptional regulator [Amycolatopsis thermoflava]ROS38901.1 DNA-binding GntR family transcriptional regulator [Amycolatopsis thermoflava]